MNHELQMIVPVLASVGIVLYLFPFIRHRVRKIPHHRLLVVSFFLLFAAWLSGLSDVFFPPKLFQFFSHLSFCLSALLFMGWTRLLARAKGPPRQ